GTSFSAPLAASVAALMLAANDKLTVAQVRARMMEGARTFPATSTTTPAPPICHVPASAADLQNAECICTTSTCGAGMLSASGAITAASRPVANVQLPPNVSANAQIMLDASISTSANNRTIVGYNWSMVTSCGASAPTISGATQPTLSLAAPASG